MLLWSKKVWVFSPSSTIKSNKNVSGFPKLFPLAFVTDQKQHRVSLNFLDSVEILGKFCWNPVCLLYVISCLGAGFLKSQTLLMNEPDFENDNFGPFLEHPSRGGTTVFQSVFAPGQLVGFFSAKPWSRQTVVNVMRLVNLGTFVKPDYFEAFAMKMPIAHDWVINTFLSWITKTYFFIPLFHNLGFFLAIHWKIANLLFLVQKWGLFLTLTNLNIHLNIG